MNKASTRRLRAATLAALAAVSLSAPAAARDGPAAMAGFYRLGPPGATAPGAACEIELLAAIAYEFEGVWYVARPLHYEDNRAACRDLGMHDIVAWSGPEAGEAVWLLAEGEAGFMEFLPGEGPSWRLAQSGHSELPHLVLATMPAIGTD